MNQDKLGVSYVITGPSGLGRDSDRMQLSPRPRCWIHPSQLPPQGCEWCLRILCPISTLRCHMAENSHSISICSTKLKEKSRSQVPATDKDLKQKRPDGVMVGPSRPLLPNPEGDGHIPGPRVGPLVHGPKLNQIIKWTNPWHSVLSLLSSPCSFCMAIKL